MIENKFFLKYIFISMEGFFRHVLFALFLDIRSQPKWPFLLLKSKHWFGWLVLTVEVLEFSISSSGSSFQSPCLLLKCIYVVSKTWIIFQKSVVLSHCRTFRCQLLIIIRFLLFLEDQKNNTEWLICTNYIYF